MSKQIPHLCKVSPSTHNYFMEDVHRAGGMMSIMGELDRAIELLSEAIDNGFGYRAWLKNDYTLEALRDDPRFQALLDRLD